MSTAAIWAKVAKKYNVHEETLRFTEVMMKQEWKPFWELSLRDSRRQASLQTLKPPGRVSFEGLIREEIVPAPHIPEGVPVSIYKPANISDDPLIVVYFHGGGLVAGDRLTCDSLMKRISTKLNAIFVSVEYRLLPCAEDPLAPFNDAVAATKWVLKNKKAVGGQGSSKIAVAGDSAGGQIVSSVTYSIKEGIAFQVMVYPVADVKCETDSCKEFYNGPGFSTLSMEKMIEIAGIGTDEMTNNPRVNPAARTDLETCPPTLIILASLDPLRDWGLALGNRIRAAGVDMEMAVIDGVPHGFFCETVSFPTKSNEAYELLKRFINSRI